MRRTLIAVLLLCGAARHASADTPVAVLENLQFHSSFWMNLHHALYAAAWDRRPDDGSRAVSRRPVGPLPSSLSAPFSTAERAAWTAAIDYYDRHVADRDLLRGRGMTELKTALAAELRSVLERAAPVYRRHFWPAHDRSNRAWIEDTAGRLRSLLPDIVREHERLYGRRWFESPVRVDVVWIGRSYTSLPPHATVDASEAALREWTRVEIVLHEVSHALILPIQRLLDEALGDRRDKHPALWHVIQFYLSGTALQRQLRSRGIEYTPYLYSTGLFDRAWSQYRKPIEEIWATYVRGEITRAQAIERTVAAVAPR
jgi:hypothetical protein